MQGTLNHRPHGRAARLAALLTLAFFATPLAFAQATSASAPPPPQVTSPLPNSRLPDPSRITIRGTASDLVRGSVKLQMSHVKNGGRVSDKTVSNGINPDRSGNWSVTMDLPKAQRGWQDVRYTITASVRWKNEHNQPHISDAWSREVTLDVFPQSQPEPLPVAPGRR